MWLLPWANLHYPEIVKALERNYPSDFATTEYYYPPSSIVKGDPYQPGCYTDSWGCTFRNIQAGLIGEVEHPILADLENARLYEPPWNQVPMNASAARDYINQYYASTDKYVFANICPQPWERYQFLRGTENAMIDMMMPELGGAELLKKIHDFNLQEMEFWMPSDFDAVRLADDWGAQNQLLIHPDMWREIFKPLYREYCNLARAYGKSVFMHSDGYILDIIPDLIEIGVDAVNSQLFCMDMGELARIAKGKITFWGEIDRQHVLPSADPDDGRRAVRKVAEHLYDPAGGIIAQFEFGAGANPKTVNVIFDEWDRVSSEWKSHDK